MPGSVAPAALCGRRAPARHRRRRLHLARAPIALHPARPSAIQEKACNRHYHDDNRDYNPCR